TDKTLSRKPGAVQGDVVHQPELRQPGNHYLVYNDKFIKISDSCPAKPPSAD
ncbi:hypothetical protein ACNVFR_005270, partial [Escherichia coli]